MGRFSIRRLLLLIHFLRLARAIPTPLFPPTDALSTTKLVNILPNSSLAAVIPNHFTITRSAPLDEPVLDQRYTLALTLHALGRLALDEFEEAQQSQTWRSSQHVSIDILGPAMTVESFLAMRKYAIWGIYKAIHLMVASNDFRPRNYELYWQEALVGWVGFNNGIYGALGITNGTANSGSGHGVRKGSLSSVLTNTLLNATTNIDLYDDRVTFAFELNGRTIGGSNVLMTLFTGILKAAPYPKTEHVQEFFVNSRAFNSFLSFKGREDSGHDGPFCEYEQLIQLFTQLPTWVMSHGNRWTEADMVVSVDGMVVGAGILKWQVRQRLGAADGGDMIS